MHHLLPKIMPILWAFTAIGNVILSILLFARKYYIRYGFLLLWCISSVLIDGLALYWHDQGCSALSALLAVYPLSADVCYRSW